MFSQGHLPNSLAGIAPFSCGYAGTILEMNACISFVAAILSSWKSFIPRRAFIVFFIYKDNMKKRVRLRK